MRPLYLEEGGTKNNISAEIHFGLSAGYGAQAVVHSAEEVVKLFAEMYNKDAEKASGYVRFEFSERTIGYIYQGEFIREKMLILCTDRHPKIWGEASDGEWMAKVEEYAFKAARQLGQIRYWIIFYRN